MMTTPAPQWLSEYWQEQTVPVWFAELKNQAWQAYLQHGLPDTTHEKWKYTDLSCIKKIDFVKNTPPDFTDAIRTIIEKYRALAHANHLIVMVNGEIKFEHSHLSGLPEETIVMPLKEAIYRHADLIKANWHAPLSDKAFAFANINTALCEDGLFVYIPHETVIAAPLHLLSIVTTDAAIFINPHHLIVLGHASQCKWIEEYVALEHTQSYFINSVTEIKLNHAAQFEHYKLVTEPQQANHMATLLVEQQEKSQADFVQFSNGCGFLRDDIYSKLLANHATFRASGFYRVRHDGQYNDQHVEIEHAAPYTQSEMFYKGILDKKSRAVFNGRLHVKPNAQKITAYQANHNLLLANTAEVYTKPELEIYADDVKCKHGATVGQLNLDALFYMRARGIPFADALVILLQGFAEEIVERISLPDLKARVRELF